MQKVPATLPSPERLSISGRKDTVPGTLELYRSGLVLPKGGERE